MLHRFLLAIPTDGADLSEINAAMDAAGQEWTLILANTFSAVWVATRAPSKLFYRELGGDEGEGVLIGRDFSNDSVTWSGCDTNDRLLDTRWGAYVAIRVDRNAQGVAVLRDPSGRIPCWRYSAPNMTIFFSHLQDLRSVFGAKLSINWKYVELHLTNRWAHGRETGFNEIDEILPGEKVQVSKRGQVVERPWRAEDVPSKPHEHIHAAGEAIAQAAALSVKSWGQLYDRLALDLSGGLDSAIVSGLLAKHAPKVEVVGINYVISHIEGDERAYARDAAEFASIDLVEYLLEPEALTNPPSFDNRLLRPSSRTIALGYDEVGLILAQRYQSDAFFTGSGGDHLFYDHVDVTAAIDHFRALGIRGLVPVIHRLAQASSSTFWAGLHAVLRSAFVRKNELPTQGDVANPFIIEELSQRELSTDSLHPSIVAAMDRASPAKFLQICHLVELQSHYWRHGRAEVAEEVHPLFSQPLIEASLRTPSHWFCQDGIQRGLARTSFRDVLPKSIAERRTKSSNNSHWTRVIDGKLNSYRDLILGGVLAKRGILNHHNSDRILTSLGLQEGKDFNAFANTLIVEQWLRSVAA